MREWFPAWVAALLAVGGFILLSWLEKRRPLRPRVEPKLRREARNLAVAALGAVALVLVEAPVARFLCSVAEQRRWGLLQQFGLPVWLELPLAVILMDYTIYLWHVLMHRVPLLWRFHLVHHVDLDMDASTALRFHFGELLFSVPWRAGQIALLGVSPLSFSVWQTFFALSIVFHHSEVTLPIAVERWLNRFIVTPRMHGIHHSIVLEEANSNWSSGLTVWDRLHRTLRLNVPQPEITIGVPACRDPQDVTLPNLLGMPLRKLPDWRLPGGAEPKRARAESRIDRLLE